MKSAALVAALGLAVPVSAGVEVGMRGGRMRLEAKSAPLSEVLDGLARETGMKVIYEGAPPRKPITISLDRETAIEVLLEVLERSSPNYALRMDATGMRAATLVVVAPVAVSADAETPEQMGAEPEIDPTSVFRDRVVTDPVTGGPPHGIQPELAEALLPPEGEHIQGDPIGAVAPDGVPSPQPTPAPQPPSPQPTRSP